MMPGVGFPATSFPEQQKEIMRLKAEVEELKTQLAEAWAWEDKAKGERDAAIQELHDIRAS